MPILLALDTSTEACSVALYNQGEVTALDEVAARTHTQRILPMIDQLLSESAISLKQLDGLVFGRGPGSFTGVRVGVSVAQGLALGADLPLYPVSNLTAMAQAAHQQLGVNEVMCAIDARMSEVYFSYLRLLPNRDEQTTLPRYYWQPIIGEQVAGAVRVIEQVATMTENGQRAKVGTGWQAYTSLAEIAGLTTDILLPSAQYMLPLALTDWAEQRFISALEVEPVYLRNEVTWKKLPGRE